MRFPPPWLLLSAILLTTGCAARQLEIQPAEPIPPPAIEAPETVTRPVRRPSWMQPAVLWLIATPGLPLLPKT